LKRIVIAADFHCGHVVGLTPPKYQVASGSLAKFGPMQKAVWQYYVDTLKKLQPIHLLIFNGDAIDGKGERSGGTELIESDRTEQVKMAIQCIDAAKAKHKAIVAGTPYHTGVTEDFERDVADGVNAKFGSHEWPEVNGVIFDCKHFIGSSVIPHGRYTSLARDQLWNQLWSIDGQQPLANIVIRSHVHYFKYEGDADVLCMTTPALQGYGSKFGARRCSGRVDIGLVSFDIDEKGGYSWRPHIMRSELQKARVLKF
jgi:hypothetical protein